TVVAHCCSNNLPTAVEPVKVTLRTSGLLVISTPTAGASVAATTLKIPAGSPACNASSAIASADSGASAAGCSTAAQPAARAGPTLRAIMALGKFHGVIAATTPTG